MNEAWRRINFGTDGWRAIIAEDFTFDNVEVVTTAIEDYLFSTYPSRPPVLVSYDSRFLADRFAKHAAQRLVELGWSVKLTDRDTPTPAIAYAATRGLSAGALQFTASHNPSQYCGLKYIPNYGGPASSEVTDSILSNIHAISDGKLSKASVAPGTLQVFDPKDEYLARIQQLIDLDCIRDSGIKIAIDSLHGTSRGYYNDLLPEAIKLGQERDPLFRGQMPEPKPECLGDLRSKVLAEGLDLGLANDGDADRFGVLDEKGNYFTPNQILCVLTKYLNEVRGLDGAVVRTVSTTGLLDGLCKKLGLELVETKVGFKHICQIMLERKVLIGGEESGGLSIGLHIPEKDGILACLLVCEAMSRRKMSLSQLWEDVVNFVGYAPASTRLDLHLTEARKQQILSELKNLTLHEFAGYKVSNVNSTDGYKFTLEDESWVLIRPSGTEPMLRIYIESPSKQALQEIQGNVLKSLNLS